LLHPQSKPRPAEIEVPPRLDQAVAACGYAHAVRQAVQDFGAWFGDPAVALTFFPEYTDHGPRHVSAVLTGAEWLVAEGAWAALTADDAAVLILATILHDCAMHLSADGFLALLAKPQGERHPAWTLLDRQSWAELFAAYMAEARRWDQRQLHRILGDEKVPPEQQPDLVTWIRHPRDYPDPERWTTTYEKFLGEFVRRHHPRLAHEIALDGVPGSVTPARRIQGVPAELLDLAGLVARSHGLPLRGVLPYLGQRYHGRITCAGCHPVFLAAVLRIADYLEIRPDRVHPARYQLQRLRSPISRDEWAAHLAIQEVRHPDDDDAEAVFVRAHPASPQEFAKLQRLLAGLQQELDTTWAVLGEIFSKQADFAHLGLTLRRVRSNLDDPEEYFEREAPDFFPVPAAFTTAGADLLKLLVGPLYGDDPAIGIRELMQNAADAVRELWQIAADRGDPGMRMIPLADQEADVLIEIDRDAAGRDWLTVTDKGIGMTAATVRNYFLKAGASLRTSDAWRRDFEVEGHSKVLRSGRFGIGALAAFLLGPRMEVWTRNIDEPPDRGIHFTAALDDDVVALHRVRLDHIGTRIRIALAGVRPLLDPNAENLWDWFVLDVPKVERRLCGTCLTQNQHYPPMDADLNEGWTRLPYPGMDVHWRWREMTLSDEPSLACNGIRVRDSEGWLPAWRHRAQAGSLEFAYPSLSVHDPDGVLPFNLRRDGLEGSPPFESELMIELVRDLLAFLLVHTPAEPTQGELLAPHLSLPLWAHVEGISLPSSWHLRQAGISNFLIVEGRLDHALYLPRETAISIRGLLNALRGDYEGEMTWMTGRKPAYRCELEKVGGDWKLVAHDTQGGVPGPLGELYDNILRGRETGVEAAYEYPIDPFGVEVEPSLITALVDDLMPSPIIPFDPDLRRQRFARAFSELSEYVKLWQRQDLDHWRKELVESFGRPSRI
jgi:molecular chaperone HtpG